MAEAIVLVLRHLLAEASFARSASKQKPSAYVNGFYFALAEKEVLTPIYNQILFDFNI